MSHEATNWAIKQRGLKPAAKIVLWHLCDRYHPDYGCFPAQDTLAEDCEMSRSSINNQLAELEGRGLIVRIVSRGKNGRHARTRYRLGFESDFPKTPCPENGHGEGGETVSKNEGSPCPKNEAHRVQNLDSNPVREPVIEPVTERGGAREDLEDDPNETPKALERRFKALELGYGGKSIAWPNAQSSSSTWGLQQFRALTPEERKLAEERRDAYLAICPKVKMGPNKGQPKPVAIGNYLREKKFLDVEVIAPAYTAKRAQPEPVKAAPFGPVWAAERMVALLSGPVDLPDPSVLRDRAIMAYQALKKGSESGAMRYLERRDIGLDADGALVFPDDFEERELARRQIDSFPTVNRLHKAAEDRRYPTSDECYAGLSHLMEAVPVGSAMWRRWHEWHERKHFPFVPPTGDHPVVYFPKGGPDALREFEHAAQDIINQKAGEANADAAV